jgi:acetoacetyl-CoA synthetase
MTRFMEFVNRKHGRLFCSYDELYDWSITNIPDFWACMWEFAGIIATHGYDTVVDDLGKMPGAVWFSGAKLNFAENLLRYKDERIALICKGEQTETITLTYAELHGQVARLAVSLRGAGWGRVTGSRASCPTLRRRL